jgi:hypothetical protein
LLESQSVSAGHAGCFESQNGKVPKSCRRQPALFAGSEHRNYGSVSERVAQEAEVLVLSGATGAFAGKPDVVEVGNWMPAKAALVRRTLAELLFTLPMFIALLMKLRRGDVALTVPVPFMLPYAFAAAAKLNGAKSVHARCLSHVFIMAGLLKPQTNAGKGDARLERADVSRA